MFSIRSVFMIFIIFLYTACGADDVENDLAMNVSGNWMGTWQGDTVNGSTNMTLTQNRTELVGMSYLNGNPCLTNCKIFGVFDSETGETNALLLDPNISDENMRNLDPFAPATSFEGLEHIVQVTGTFTKTGYVSMSYHVIEWSFCDGAIGIINMNLQE